jgi:hypothetical protein
VNWSDGSTANPRTDSGVAANKSVTANFAINTYTLTYSAGPNGTVSGTTPQTVTHGSSGTTVTVKLPRIFLDGVDRVDQSSPVMDREDS